MKNESPPYAALMLFLVIAAAIFSAGFCVIQEGVILYKEDREREERLAWLEECQLAREKEEKEDAQRSEDYCKDVDAWNQWYNEQERKSINLQLPNDKR